MSAKTKKPCDSDTSRGGVCYWVWADLCTYCGTVDDNSKSPYLRTPKFRRRAEVSKSECDSICILKSKYDQDYIRSLPALIGNQRKIVTKKEERSVDSSGSQKRSSKKNDEQDSSLFS